MTSGSDGFNFERRVAAIYRILGANVQHDVALAGNQIDILLDEETVAGTSIRSAVECKLHLRPIGINTINAFASLLVLLRSRNLVERGILVSHSGFTKTARAAAQEHGLDLVEFADLEQRVAGREAEVFDVESQLHLTQQVTVERSPKRAPVVMPFSKEYNDIYVFGIRDVAEELGIVAERADDIQHNDSIPDVIRNRIKRSDVVIAETTAHNPNVYYEVGLAHGIGRPTVLVCKDAGTIPFDLTTINHIVYESISELRTSLSTRLRATLDLNAS